MYCSCIILGACEGLDNVANGKVVYNKRPKYDVYTVASFSCDFGYRLSGSNSITCKTSGNWTAPQSICKPSNKTIFEISK